MKTHPRLKWVALIAFAVLMISLLVGRPKGEDSSAPLRSFAENLNGFADESTFSLADLTPWDWDTAILVRADIGHEQLEKLVGAEIPAEFADAAEDAKEGGSDSFCIVFCKEDNVVFVLSSFSRDCTYALEAEPFFALAKGEQDTLRFTSNDNLTFSKTSYTENDVLWDVCSLQGDVAPYLVLE